MRYDIILFDADDTLLDFGRAERDALLATLQKHGLPSDETVVSAYSKINDSHWKRLERGETTKAKLRVDRFADLCTFFSFDASPYDMARDYESALSGMGYIFDGAEELCALTAKKYKLYMVTNGIKDVQKGRVERSGLAKYFSGIFISEEMGREKPHVEFFERVAERIGGLDKERTLIIGDSMSSDIRGGRNFGIDTCWFNWENKVRPDDIDITYTVSSYEEIKELLEV